MPLNRPALRTLAAAVACAVVVAACAGGDDDLAIDEPAAETTVASTTTSSTTTTAPATTTTTAPGPVVAPLTGLPVQDEAALQRPALFLKIDNHPDSRPQSALDHADVVIEMLAEYQLSRFAAVFHSEAPEHVGPVRSSRTSDFELLRAFGSPLYGSSGGNDYVMSAMRDLPVHAVTDNDTEVYYRDSSRRRPHNLYVDTTELFALAAADDGPPPAWFAYRDEGEPLPPSAQPFDGEVTVRWGFPVTFRWDGERQGWTRTQQGRPHVLSDGTRVAPANVVILAAEYRTSPADRTSPELVSVGEGDAVVLTAGHLVAGRWSRPSPEQPPTLVDGDGSPIELTPGQTWVLWPRSGNVAY